MDKPLVRQDLVASEVKVVLDEIFAFCADACDARRTAFQGSAEWHKRTGEILAYARMTSLLSRLETATNVPGDPERDANIEWSYS
jgi:hypothetical protein